MTEEREIIEIEIVGFDGAEGSLLTRTGERFMLGVNMTSDLERYQVGRKISNLIITGQPLRGRIIEFEEGNLRVSSKDEKLNSLFLPETWP